MGVSYPEKFRIDLNADPFPWFLLAVLFGARITESIAVKTFYLFKIEGLLSPLAIIAKGWQGLVGVLDAGGYTRYDFKTATKLIEMSENVVSLGTLGEIHRNAADSEALISDLKALAKGIGDVTVGIFLREMVGIWDKARPYPSDLVRKTSVMLKIDPLSLSRELGVSYGMMESFLVRVGRRCFRSGCEKCLFPDLCKEYIESSGKKSVKGR